MSEKQSKKLFADPGTTALVKRLIWEQASAQKWRYVLTGILALIAAAATGLGAYLIKYVIDAAYVDKNLNGIIYLGFVTAVIFLVKAVSIYLSSVSLARIGNRIIAE